MQSFIQSLPYTVPAVLIAIVLHEWAHGYISYRLGDPSPKLEGRLSLNPLRHLDPVGTFCLLFFHFGWAKPISVDARYYKDPKMGMILTALAGPIMNFIIAIAFALLHRIILATNALGLPFSIALILLQLCSYTTIINIGLGLFNLIPIPPLDGSKALFGMLPDELYFSFMRFEQYGSILLLVMLLTGVLTPLLNYCTSSIYQSIHQILSIFI